MPLGLMTDWRRMLQWLTRDWRLCLKSVFQVPSFMFQVVEVAPRNLKLETRNAESTDRGFQCDFGLHGVGNQTIMLRFFNEFLRTGRITAWL